MQVLLYIAAAACGYFVGGINPAIAMSKAIYHQDIRECGSGNPGFTNFRRTFGNRWAWWVLALDLTKAAVVVGCFAWLFGTYLGDRQLGAAYTGVFAMLGHAYPMMYGFKGGKGFLVCLSTMWVIDWRTGLFATVFMVVLLLITKYMSLSTMLAIWSCPVTLAVCKASAAVIVLCVAMALLMTFRHKENIKRLCERTERRFTLKGTSNSG